MIIYKSGVIIMKLEQNSQSMLFSQTILPDIFFTEYLTESNGDHLKVYLYLLFLAKYNKEIKLNDLTKKLSLPLNVIQDSIKYWEEIGLITKKNTGYIINNIQEIELHKLYKPKISIAPKDIEKNIQSQYRAKIIESINTTFFQGIMSPGWYTDIELWFKKYSFDGDVMRALFQYCFDKSALHRNYIGVVADAWSKNNIKTYNDLESYFQKQEKLSKFKKAISKKLGINRSLTQYEEAYIEKWVIDFGYTLPIIEIALKKTTSKSNPTFDYVDKLLTDWNERKLATEEEIQTYLLSFKKKKENIKELEKKAKYNNYEQRQYNDLDSLYANTQDA